MLVLRLKDWNASPRTPKIEQELKRFRSFACSHLGPSINGLVTDGNTKISCQDFILALFQNTTAYKIDSQNTQDYMKIFSVSEVEILQVNVNKIEFLLR